MVFQGALLQTSKRHLEPVQMMQFDTVVARVIAAPTSSRYCEVGRVNLVSNGLSEGKLATSVEFIDHSRVSSKLSEILGAYPICSY